MARLLLTRTLLVAALGALALGMAGAPGRAVAATQHGTAMAGDRWVWPGPPDVRVDAPAFYDARRGLYSYIQDRSVLWTLTPDTPRTWTAHPIQGPTIAGSAFDPWAIDLAGDRFLTLRGQLVPGDTCCSYHWVATPWQLTLGDSPQWSLLPVRGAGATYRDYSMMAYDSRRHRVLVFGGYASDTSQVLSPRIDVLDASGDSAAWTGFDVPGAGLPVRRACAVYDSVTDRLLAIGGESPNGIRASIYSLDLAAPTDWVAWSLSDSLPVMNDVYFPARLLPDLPHRRLLYVATRLQLIYDRARGPATDAASTTTDSTFVRALSLDAPDRWQWIPYAGVAPPLSAPEMLYDPVRDRVSAFGISDLNGLAELTLDGASPWVVSQLCVPIPGLLGAHVFDDPAHGAVVYDSQYPAIWTAVPGPLASWTQLRPVGNRPPRRSGAMVTYDPTTHRGWVFGGTASGAELGDLWQFTLDDSGDVFWSRLLPGGDFPSPRWGAVSVLDPVRHRMIVSGGFAGIPVADTWALMLDPPVHWQRLPDRGAQPPARTEGSAVYDSRRDAMLVFGGHAESLMDDLWELSFADGDAWQALAAFGTPPSARAQHAAVYDPLRDRMLILWGNSYTGSPADCMELDLADGPTWRPFAPVGPLAGGRVQFAAMYQAATDRAVIVGGYGTSPLNAFADVLYADFSANPVRTPPPAHGPALAVLGLAPNPSRDVVNVAFNLPVDAIVHARIYSAAGRLVRDFDDRRFVAGQHLLVWDGKDASGARAASGVYFARLSMLGREFSGKLVFLH